MLPIFTERNRFIDVVPWIYFFSTDGTHFNENFIQVLWSAHTQEEQNHKVDILKQYGQERHLAKGV